MEHKWELVEELKSSGMSVGYCTLCSSILCPDSYQSLPPPIACSRESSFAVLVATQSCTGDSMARSTQDGQCSHADAGSIGPSALPASAAVIGSISAQLLPATRHSQRGRPVPAGSKGRPMHAWASDFAALPLPRRGAQAAADLAAKHTAPGGSDLPIEGARTHAPTISMGALLVFLRFSAPSPRADRPRRAVGARHAALD